MARPAKATVDYFPHDCNYGKTIPILESKFGIIGYAVWYKLLEQIGRSENHYIDCNDDEIWLFLASDIKIEEDLLRQILDLLARLNAIDKKLWEDKQVIFSEKFIERITDAYRNRKASLISKAEVYKIFGLEEFLTLETNLSGVSDVRNPQEHDVSDVENPQSKEKKRKEKKKKEEESASSSENFSSIDSDAFCHKVINNEHLSRHLKDKKIEICDIKAFYDYLIAKFDTNIVFIAIESYLKKKVNNAPLGEYHDFRTDFENWLSIEKAGKSPHIVKSFSHVDNAVEKTKRRIEQEKSIKHASPYDDKETAVKWLAELSEDELKHEFIRKRVDEVKRKWELDSSPLYLRV